VELPNFNLKHARGCRNRARYPGTGLPGALDLDRRLRATRRAGLGVRCHIPSRRNAHLGKLIRRSAQLLPPAINLAPTNLATAGHFADDSPRRKLSATIARFCSSLRRRRSRPVITSTRAIALSLAPVQAPMLALVPISPINSASARPSSAEGYAGEGQRQG